MAQPQPQEQSLYGLPVPVTKAPPTPIIAKRDPVPSDTGYPLSQLWINNVLATAWILTQVQGGLATWIPILGAGAGVQTISGFLPIASNFNFLNLGGLTIGGAAGQFSAGVNVTGPVLSIVANSIEAQVSSASAISDPLVNGVAHFDSAQFSVDANGFVQLSGGGIAMDQIAVQATTAPGVSPVDPDGTGLVTINGTSVGAVGIPVQSRSIALNSLQIEVQTASAQVASAAANAGLASFDKTQFFVDGNGYVQLAGGGIAIDQIGVDAFTGPGTNPVDPTVAGLVTITGNQVAAGTTVNSIRTHSTALNSLTVEVQRSSAQAAPTVGANGVCHFNSAQFTVDADGFVSSLAGTAPWLDSGGGALANHTGYFATAAAAYTLPAGAVNGDMVEIVDVVGGGVVLTAQGADIIQISNVASSAGGTATSSQKGDSLRLSYRQADLTWWAVPGAAGNWLLA